MSAPVPPSKLAQYVVLLADILSSPAPPVKVSIPVVPTKFWAAGVVVVAELVSCGASCIC